MRQGNRFKAASVGCHERNDTFLKKCTVAGTWRIQAVEIQRLVMNHAQQNIIPAVLLLAVVLDGPSSHDVEEDLLCFFVCLYSGTCVLVLFLCTDFCFFIVFCLLIGRIGCERSKPNPSRSCSLCCHNTGLRSFLSNTF